MNNNIMDIVKLQENDFNWFDRKYKASRERVYLDVSINKIKSHNSPAGQYSIIFRNDCFKHFENDYIQMAISGDRLYFRGVKKGLKLSGNSKASDKNNRYVRTANELLYNFIGDYDLKWDKEYQLYYIERTLI